MFARNSVLALAGKRGSINGAMFYKVFEQYPFLFFKKTLKIFSLHLNNKKDESALQWLLMLEENLIPTKNLMLPSIDQFKDGTQYNNCRSTEYALKYFLSLLLLTKEKKSTEELNSFLKKNIHFLNKELFSMKLSLDERRSTLQKKLEHLRFQENSEFSFFNPLKLNIRMLNFIGKGGFAEVWEVFNATNMELYAAKIHKIQPNVDDNIKLKIVKRAENEIRIHLNCHRHTFIVKLEFFFVFGSAMNLLVGMELCDIDLDKFIKSNGPINEVLAVSWVKQILTGLLYMKQLPRGRVHHCDLKPANLLIKNGTIKISDFGLSQIIPPDENLVFYGGGTLYYQPPECIKLKEKLYVTDKIDIWSLGCILYEMIYAKRPFQFNYFDKCTKEVLIAKMQKKIHFPRKKTVSRITKHFIEYLLTYNYKKRPSIEQAIKFPIFDYFGIP